MCAIVIVPIPFIDDKALFGFMIWFLLFFGGFLLPPLTGLMLNSVDENLRTSANSLANLSYNCLGYMPAPILYGFISSLVETNKTKMKSRIPLTVILYSVFLTTALVTWIIRRKHKKYL